VSLRLHFLVYYFASAIVPQFGQRRLSSLDIHCSMNGLSCVPMSVKWNDASRMTVGSSCSGARQYQRSRSMAALGRTLSITIPTVLAKRTGLCGVLPGSKNISPSLMLMSRKMSSSTTRRSMSPLCGMQTEVVHWWLQAVSIISEPMEKVEGGREGHFRGFSSSSMMCNRSG